MSFQPIEPENARHQFLVESLQYQNKDCTELKNSVV